MKIIKKEDWNYTLYDIGGEKYLIEVMVSSKNSGWAVYEVIHVLNFFEKGLIKIFPGEVSKIAQRIREREK
jgi:hypothetical protein